MSLKFTGRSSDEDLDLLTGSVRRALRNVFVVGFPNALQSAAVFARGVILARMLSVHDFALAVILISMTGALDIFADAGIDRFVVQHRFGFRPDIMRTSHAYRVGGSLLFGSGIAIVSYPLALIFHAPSIWPAIAATGGVVSLRGFVNLNYKLQQREHRFERETMIDSSRIAVDLALTAGLAYWTHSYLAPLGAAYGNALTQLVLSHLMARSGYGFWPRRRLVGIVGRFSMPIYLNATMLFAAMQGDRLIVASMFLKRELAIYTVACTIGQGIASLVGKVTERLLLPIFVPRDRPHAVRRKAVNRVGILILAGSFGFLVLTSLISPLLTGWIYGPAYHGLRQIVAAAAIFQMIQIQQAWLNSVIIANGLTSALPMVTMMRAAAFPAAILFVSLGLSLVSIPLAFALGAAASLAYSFYATRSLQLIDKRLIWTVFLGISAAIAVAAARAFQLTR
jgi:O-antigen/teichoic acid export membrane protein